MCQKNKSHSWLSFLLLQQLLLLPPDSLILHATRKNRASHKMTLNERRNKENTSKSKLWQREIKQTSTNQAKTLKRIKKRHTIQENKEEKIIIKKTQKQTDTRTTTTTDRRARRRRKKYNRAFRLKLLHFKSNCHHGPSNLGCLI